MPFVLAAALHAANPGQDDATYREFVKRVQAGDFTVDFRALRLACMKSAQCQPRATKADLMELNRAEAANDLHRVVEIAERLIQEGFVNLDAHATCSEVHERLNEPRKAQFHLNVTNALIRSILDRSDGKTKQSAFEVISDREEYAVMVSLGLPYIASPGASARTLVDGSHHYDEWVVPNPKTGKSETVFFNTDAFSAKSIAANR